MDQTHDRRNILAVIIVTGIVVVAVVAAAFVLSLLGKDPLPGELIAVVPSAVTGLLAWLAPSPLQRIAAVNPPPAAPPTPPPTPTPQPPTGDAPPSGGGSVPPAAPVVGGQTVATVGPAMIGF